MYIHGAVPRMSGDTNKTIINFRHEVLRCDIFWLGGPDASPWLARAQELVGLQPDIILTNRASPTVALQRETRTIPIVFANVTDPIAQHIVARLR
jgi:putative tryptophan/tyrosine transport system substrate-binding protein